ncbi:hypothetical protein ACQJBY_002982 [Aegilops geniculata]
MVIAHMILQKTECVADPIDGTNVDDYNPEIIPIADDVDKIYPRVHITPSERIILEQTDGDSTYVHQPSHLVSDNPPISFLYNGDSLPAPSNLTQNFATDVQQSSNVALNVAKQTLKNGMSDEKREQYNARRRAAYRKKKEDGTVKRQDENQPSLPMSGMIH